VIFDCAAFDLPGQDLVLVDGFDRSTEEVSVSRRDPHDVRAMQMLSAATLLRPGAGPGG
jgi:hypothetical protein